MVSDLNALASITIPPPLHSPNAAKQSTRALSVATSCVNHSPQAELLPMNIPVNLVIFASRESVKDLAEAFEHAKQGLHPGSFIDVLINGNEELATHFVGWFSNKSLNDDVKCRIWSLEVADKANAWNQHIHEIWHQGLDAIYVDGYARVTSNAVSSLLKTMKSNAEVLGSSGVPTVGRSAKSIAKTMEIEGGFHGNLCAIRSTAMAEMRKRKIRIPVGMYRVDAIMGAFLSFGLKNDTRIWEPKRYIPVTFDATWNIESKKWYRPQDIIAWHRRSMRQSRGKVENAAVKYHLTVENTAFEHLPEDIGQLFNRWKSACPADAAVMERRYRSSFQYLEQFNPPDPLALPAKKRFESSSRGLK